MAAASTQSAEERFVAMMRRIQELEDQVKVQAATVQAATTQADKITASATRKEPKITGPKAFSGKRTESQEFILKCETVFTAESVTYINNATKLAYAVNLLENEAYEWVKPALMADKDKKPGYIQTWIAFKKEFLKIFSDIDIQELSYQRLQVLKQTGSASTYANEFRRHSLNLSWNDQPLRQHFFRGLKPEVKDKVLSPTDFADLDALIEQSIKWDNLLYQRRKDPNNRQNSANIPSSQQKSSTNNANKSTSQNPKPQQWNGGPQPKNLGIGPGPMQVDSVRGPLSQAEKYRRRQNRLCFYCGEANHTANNCPAAKASSARRKAISSIEPSQESSKATPQ
jgi:hypothetical protein